ncbi:hypothetical protein K8352_12725 [Flavobacteriaceae bacterium F89]|uniref:Uncharacterized protein n=1 Tax=Cerina litoralis TaxID=2874477 RepID=A0AAE3EXP3_9FLAO|nr:hypothetical protein [Cerina litoralis]MCG2461617.1 hypothetical protein [Cerina litoralis]
MRVALDIGYNVFPYEATNGSDGKEREIEQAKNIQKVIEERPNEKFLIYCGYDHVLEGNHKSWGKAMAGRLSEYTGINPLTINQVAFSEKSRPEYNNPLLKALEIKWPTVLLDQQNNPYKYQRGESWTDVAVFYPNTKYRNCRPNWLFENGVKSVPTELEDLDISFPVLILAYKKEENIIDGIPLDILEVKDKADKINLALKRRDYQIVIINRKGDARKLNLKVN